MWNNATISDPSYVAVVKLANCYYATLVANNREYILSKTLVSDEKIAVIAAENFSQLLYLPYYRENALIAINPTMTMLFKDDTWYPVDLEAESITALKSIPKFKVDEADLPHMRQLNVDKIVPYNQNTQEIGPIPISGETFTVVSVWAEFLANKRGLRFIPQIGISFYLNQSKNLNLEILKDIKSYYAVQLLTALPFALQNNDDSSKNLHDYCFSQQLEKEITLYEKITQLIEDLSSEKP